VEERLRQLDDDLRASLRNTAEAVELEALSREQTRLALLEVVEDAGREAAKEAEKLNAALRRESAARAEGDASVAATCTLLQQLCAELKAEDKEAGLRLRTETGAVGEQVHSLQSRLDAKLRECSTDMGGLRTRLEQHAQEVRCAGATQVLSHRPDFGSCSRSVNSAAPDALRMYAGKGGDLRYQHAVGQGDGASGELHQDQRGAGDRALRTRAHHRASERHGGRHSATARSLGAAPVHPCRTYRAPRSRREHREWILVVSGGVAEAQEVWGFQDE